LRGAASPLSVHIFDGGDESVVPGMKVHAYTMPVRIEYIIDLGK
jgi:hypothetical protein